MSDSLGISSAAKGLSRNSLGIIALFIVLVYGFAALTLGINSSLQPAERAPLVWFLVMFPVFVLIAFGWLVSKHHEKLYAPGDYKSDEGFLEGLNVRSRHTADLQKLQEDLKSRIRETIIESSTQNSLARKEVDSLVERLTHDVDRATTLTVDASDFLKSPAAVYTFPMAAFETLSDLTNEIYFKLRPLVGAFEYGHSWVLRNRETGDVIRNARMITRSGPGRPLPDTRSLREAGIEAGSTLCVASP